MFQATLTLPGIAGIVLTMGMALDANVIIFEENSRRVGKMENRSKLLWMPDFQMLFSAVVDTHLTTFLSGLVLYHFWTVRFVDLQ